MSAFRLKSEKTATARMITAKLDKLSEFKEGYVRNAPTSPVHTNMQDLREKLKLQKNEMAELLEVAERTYYAYERGLRAIPSTTLIKLAMVTGVDLNEILLGHPAQGDFNTVRCAVDDLMLIRKYLSNEYPEMDEPTRTKVARLAVTTDWQGWSRMHPSVIRDAVRMVTRYRFHPEDIPAPPLWEDYGEKQDEYEEAIQAWQTKIDEDFET
jgi:DNA-binding XRE family transcriptional regulator